MWWRMASSPEGATEGGACDMLEVAVCAEVEAVRR